MDTQAIRADAVADAYFQVAGRDFTDFDLDVGRTPDPDVENLTAFGSVSITSKILSSRAIKESTLVVVISSKLLSSRANKESTLIVVKTSERLSIRAIKESTLIVVKIAFTLRIDPIV